MSTIKTNSKSFAAKINPYLLDAVNGENYGKELATDKEKLQHVADCFKSEYCFPANLKRYGSYQNVFAQWLMGLPSCYSIDYEHYRIIELAKEWGSLAPDVDDRQEDKILDNWFNFIAFKTFQLMRKHGINPY